MSAQKASTVLNHLLSPQKKAYRTKLRHSTRQGLFPEWEGILCLSLTRFCVKSFPKGMESFTSLSSLLALLPFSLGLDFGSDADRGAMQHQFF